MAALKLQVALRDDINGRAYYGTIDLAPEDVVLDPKVFAERYLLPAWVAVRQHYRERVEDEMRGLGPDPTLAGKMGVDRVGGRHGG